MVKIVAAEVLHVAIPLRVTFRHALAEREVGQSTILRLAGDDGTVGFGECAPRDYVTGETSASVERTLHELLRGFVGSEFTSLHDAAVALESAAVDLPRERHAAFCALELAVLDLTGRSLGESAGDVLGPIVQPTVRYSGVVSADDPGTVRALCERMRAMDLHSVKVKVGRSAREDGAVLRTVREVMGPAIGVRIDANCAWTPDAALARLHELAEFALEGAEQPVAAADFDGMAWLTARSPVPIIADESLVSVHDAQRLAAARGCHVFNVRISKCGGMLVGKRIRDIGIAAGIGSMLGCQVGETALLSCAGRHFSTRVPGVLHHEGSFGTMLLDEDVGTAEVAFGRGGEAPALASPGLGVPIDEARVRAWSCGASEECERTG